MEILILVFQLKENYCDITVSIKIVSLVPDELPVSKKYFWYDSLEEKYITRLHELQPAKRNGFIIS